jgi:hypothetical protein
MSLGQDIRATLDALDIHVDAVRPGLLGCDHLLTQTGKVSREDGRSKLYGMCVHVRAHPAESDHAKLHR